MIKRQRQVNVSKKYSELKTDRKLCNLSYSNQALY